jgi:YegS/Rv2252/BmrU family lipid kinase
MRTALLIYNPAAGRRRAARRLARLVGALRDGGIAAEPVATLGRGHATELARTASGERGLGLVLAWGGDGTVREVAAGLLGSECVLGVLPGGTVNVVAGALGLPRHDAVAAARRLGALAPRRLDVGSCAGHPFLMQATCGIESWVIARLYPRLKRGLGFTGPILQAVGALWRYPFPDLEIEADGERLRAKGVMVCNISEVAGRHRAVPDGRHDDGRLDLLLFRGNGPRAMAGFAADLFLGRHARRGDVEIRPVEHVRFMGPRTVPVQIDGDALAEHNPIEVRLLPQPLLALAEA